MARLRLPYASAAVLDAATPQEREILFDTDADEVRIGDGSTLGGIKLGKKNASASTVIATGSTTARSLEDRFAERRRVLDYGAVWDGSSHPLSGYFPTLAAARLIYPHAVALTDEIDWAAAQAAVNLGGIIEFPDGTGLFNRQLTVGDGSAAAPSTLQNVQLLGRTVPAGNQITAPTTGTIIKFTGASGTDSVIRLLGPITTIVEGFTINCNFLANSGVWATHPFRSRFRNNYVGKHLGIAWRFDCWPTAVSGITTGGSSNVLDNCFCGEPGSTTTTCLKIGSPPTGAGATDIQRLYVQNSSFLSGNSVNSVGVHFDYCDQVFFFNVFVSSGFAPNSCNAKLFKITANSGGLYPSATGYFPQNLYFSNTYFICDGVNGYDIDSNWVAQNGRGAMFWPFMRGEVELATNPVPSHALLWGITDAGEYFGKIAEDLGSGVAVPHTGDTTETVLATITIPANTMGKNGFVEVDVAYSMTNNANAKTTRARLGGIGGTVMDSSTLTSVAAQRRTFRIRNRGAQNSQVCASGGATSGLGTINAPATGSVDTSAATTLVLTGQLSNSADTITLEEYTARIVRRD